VRPVYIEGRKFQLDYLMIVPAILSYVCILYHLISKSELVYKSVLRIVELVG